MLVRHMRIVIYNHRRDAVSGYENNYVLWAMSDLWREDGHQVEIVFGPNPIRADVAIVHVDRTRVSRAYLRAARRADVVLNGKAVDISKRKHSQNLITRQSDWNGQAIVKTSRNSGGVPEVRHYPRIRDWQKRRVERLGIAHTWWMYSSSYAIFDSVSEVPDRVFRNRHLVVEKFLPERESDLYCVRYFKFFGGRSVSAVLRGPDPVVKRRDVVSFEDISPAPEVVAMKEDIGFQYGKLDYVMYEGLPIVFDVNKTPGMSADSELARQASILAPGLYGLLDSRRPVSTS